MTRHAGSCAEWEAVGGDGTLTRTAVECTGAAPSSKRKKSHTTPVHAVWFAWYALDPKMWSATGDRQKRSDAKLLVALLKLFLVDGFVLDEHAPSYRDAVHGRGLALLAYVADRLITAKGSGAVLNKLRELHRSGVLDAKIQA